MTAEPLQSLKVWIRVYAWISPNSDSAEDRYALVVPSVAVELYRTQEEAEASLKTHGGIVVETTAASLRGSFEDHAYIDYGYAPEKPARFIDHDKPTLTLKLGPSLPHEVKHMPDGDTSLEFANEDARQWVDTLEKETELWFSL